MKDLILDVVEQLYWANEVFAVRAHKCPTNKIEIFGLRVPSRLPIWLKNVPYRTSAGADMGLLWNI